MIVQKYESAWLDCQLHDTYTLIMVVMPAPPVDTSIWDYVMRHRNYLDYWHSNEHKL